MAKVRSGSKDTTKQKAPKEPARGTGLFVPCYKVMFDVAHQSRVEVRVCRNGSYHVHCPGCRTTAFVWGEEWRAKALTREQVEGMRDVLVYPVLGAPDAK